MHWKHLRSWLIPLICALSIKIFSFFPEAVEKYYSNGIYPVISRTLRILFGWIPLSIGDILYAVCLTYLIYSLVRFVSRAFGKYRSRLYFLLCLKRICLVGIWLYFTFNFLWGLNYDRLPLAQKMDLDEKQYSREELRALVGLLVNRMNDLDSASLIARKDLLRHDRIFHQSVLAYQSLSHSVPGYRYANPSVKFSFYGYLANYMGFSGYYNPFSGEAQVNTTIPGFVQPFTSCHEIGHQLGYAKEEEANFCAFLSARSSPDPAFRYSVYAELYLYAGTALYMMDSTAFIPYRESLKPAVRDDLRELKAFYRKYENPFEPIIHMLYGNYLKANRQPQGINSYDEVVGLTIAYYKKYGSAAF